MKRFFSIVLVICIVSLTFSLSAQPVTAEDDSYPHLTTVPEGYIGIYTKEDLNNVRNNLSANYIIMNDIIFNDADFAEGGEFYNNGLGWEPIGGYLSQKFTGILEGNYYSIYGIKMSPDCTKNYNSFIALNYGQILGLTLKVDMQINENILSPSNNMIYLSSLCNSNEGIIKECNVLGNIDINIPRINSDIVSQNIIIIGGLTVYNSNIITMCSSDVDISVNSDNELYKYGFSSVGIGGICTTNKKIVSNCCFTGSIKTSPLINFKMKTLIGGITSSSSELYNSYSSGTFSTKETFGALIGNNSSDAINKNNYALEGTAQYTYNSFQDEPLTEGFKTDEQMKQQATYNNWDFKKIWSIDEDNSYPKLRITNRNFPEKELPDDTFSGGNGSKEAPYIITTKEQLYHVRYNLDANYILGNDIIFNEEDFSENGDYYNNGLGWKPIDNIESENEAAFSGIFDGNGYGITNLYMYKPKYYSNKDNLALFNSVTGTIKNLSVLVKVVCEEQNYNFGTITVDNYGNIENCTSHGSVFSEGACGGIAHSNSGNITSCANYVYINSPHAGGIAEYNSGNIDKCFNAGKLYVDKVNSNSNAGGITGNNSGIINNCFNAESITVNCEYINNVHIGGITGYNQYLNNNSGGYIYNSYNVGDINFLSQNYSACSSGGIIGTTLKYAVFNNCYYLDNGVKGIGEGKDTSTLLTLTEIKNQVSFKDFDFDSVWTMGDNSRYPFPVLKSVPIVYIGKHGDINNDFQITASDALLVLQYSVNKIELDQIQTYLSDIDINNQVTAADALLILQASVGKVVIM